jgi:outer membrane protein insertion porin family
MTSLRSICLALVAIAAVAAASGASYASDLEEQRPYIGSIKFVGNQHVGDGKLRSIMRTKEPGFFQLFNRPRFRADFLRYDLQAIVDYYHKTGYYQATAEVIENRYDPDENANHVVIGIHEGEQTLVGDVGIEGELPIKSGDVIKRLKLKRNAPFDSTMIGSDIYYIRNRMWDQGYVVCEISSSVKLTDHTANITYKVSAGPQMSVGDIKIAGNRVTSEKRIRDQLTFKSGEIFRLKKIQDSQQYLFDTSLFRQVNLVASKVDTLGRTVDLLVEVEERKMSYLELGLGIGTEDNGRVAAEWGHRYVPGLGGKLQLNTELAFDVVREGRAKLVNRFTRNRAAYTGPRFPGTRFQTAVDAYYEKDRNPNTVDYDVWGFGLHGRRRMGRYTVLYLDFSNEFIKRKIPELEEPSPFTRKSDETRALGATIDRDARDDLLYPSSGTHRSIRAEVAGGPVRGDNNFTRVVGSFSYYTRVWKGMVCAVRAKAGMVTPYGRSNDGRDPDGVPYENRFYAGGSNSVRGYGENSLGPRLPVGAPGAIDPREAALRGDAAGGEMLLLTNVELRLTLWKKISLGGVLFLDGGNVWDEPSDVKLEDFEPRRHMPGGGYTAENVTKYRYSFGAGLRYNTPIGPLRLDYGVPISRTGEINSTGMFHFNLGHAF